MSLEVYVLDIITGRRSSMFIKGFLYVFSCLYRGAIALRNWSYDRGLYKTTKSKLPVISIGNIVVGGTGKTPLVKFLAQELIEFGKVAILSRGYRSKIEKINQVQKLVKEESSCHSALLWGDEPTFLQKNIPQALVIVGRDRIASSELACQERAQFLILDDGLQHRRLQRDVEIVVIDAEDPFGKGYYLPRGFLRDSPKRLRQADLVVVNHVEDEDQYHLISKQISVYTKAPTIGTRMKVKDDAFFKNKKIGAFCGIAKPDKFLNTLRKHGAEIIESLVLSDHQAVNESSLESFALKCKNDGAKVLVCTEKDQIKLPLDIKSGLPIKALEADLEIVFGIKEWQQIIDKIKNLKT
jgi:tetraacyldisaccharide 4'-kinase